jgi:glycogen operon protein
MTVFLNGDAITEPDPHGAPVRDDSFLIMLTADREPLEFTVPGPKFGERWAMVLDTARDEPTEPPGTGQPAECRPGDRLQLTGGSMVVLRRISGG